MVLPCCWTSEMKCLNIFLKCTLSVSVIFCLFLKPQRNFFILINLVCRVKKNVPFRSTKFPVGCRFLMYGKDFDADPLSAETAPPTFVSIKNGQVGEWIRWMGAKYVDFQFENRTSTALQILQHLRLRHIRWCQNSYTGFYAEILLTDDFQGGCIGL